jgi:hypothetical protein
MDQLYISAGLVADLAGASLTVGSSALAFGAREREVTRPDRHAMACKLRDILMAFG